MNKTMTKVGLTTGLILLLAACSTNGTKTQSQKSSSPTSPTAEGTATQETNTKDGNSKSGNKASVTTINVTETDTGIKLSDPIAPEGKIKFITHNKGKTDHELVILKTDLAPDQLPMKNGLVDEEGPGVKNVAELSETQLKSQAKATLSADLKPGKYVIVCNLPGHFKAGMKAAFTVEPKTP